MCNFVQLSATTLPWYHRRLMGWMDAVRYADRGMGGMGWSNEVGLQLRVVAAHVGELWSRFCALFRDHTSSRFCGHRKNHVVKSARARHAHATTPPQRTNAEQTLVSNGEERKETIAPGCLLWLARFCRQERSLSFHSSGVGIIPT